MKHIGGIHDDCEIPVEADCRTNEHKVDLAIQQTLAYFSFIGTIMYFLLKMSTLDDHFRTLGYASSKLLISKHRGPWVYRRRVQTFSYY